MTDSTKHQDGIGIYLRVFGALLCLTITTVVAAYIDMGSFNNVVAMAIAIVKGVLVLLFFMHLRDSKPLAWIAMGGGIFWFLVLVGFTLADVLTRNMVGYPGT